MSVAFADRNFLLFTVYSFFLPFASSFFGLQADSHVCEEYACTYARTFFLPHPISWALQQPSSQTADGRVRWHAHVGLRSNRIGSF